LHASFRKVSIIIIIIIIVVAVAAVTSIKPIFTRAARGTGITCVVHLRTFAAWLVHDGNLKFSIRNLACICLT